MLERIFHRAQRVPRVAWSDVPFAQSPWRHDAGRYVLSFTTRLPFSLAIEEQWTAVVSEANELDDITADAVSVSFSQFREEPELPPYFSIVPKWRRLVREFRRRANVRAVTSCEIVLRPAGSWEPSPLALSRSFDQGLRAVNRLLAEYAVLTEDWTIHEVAKEELPAVALMTFKDLRDPYHSYGLMRLHRLDGVMKQPVTSQVLLQLERRAASPPERGDLRAFHYHRVKADRLPDLGRYGEAIIEASMAIEAYVHWLRLRRSHEIGEDLAYVETSLEDRGLKAIVRGELHPWLGGTWDLTRADTPIGQWYTDLHLLRNRCVHSGYRPSYGEAKSAVSAGQAFTDYVLARLVDTGRRAWVEEGLVEPMDPIVGYYEWEAGLDPDSVLS